jgi:P2 family phage contractile tail tube protein
MSVKFPLYLKNFNLILGPTDYAGVVEEVILPKISYKSEEILNAGMAMPIKMPTVLEAMDVTFKMSEQTFEGFVLAGAPTAGLVEAVVHGHLQNALGATSELIYAMRGTILKVENGSAKNSDLKAGMQTLEMNLMSLLVTRDNIPIFTVDAQNGVIKHGVFDHFESARKNLKLG